MVFRGLDLHHDIRRLPRGLRVDHRLVPGLYFNGGVIVHEFDLSNELVGGSRHRRVADEHHTLSKVLPIALQPLLELGAGLNLDGADLPAVRGHHIAPLALDIFDRHVVEFFCDR